MRIDRRILFLILSLILLVSLTAVSAETFVEFRDGRYIEVRSHTVDEGRLWIEVSRGNSIVVPLDQIQRVRRNGSDVFLAQAALPEKSTPQPTLVLSQAGRPARLAPTLAALMREDSRR